MVQLEFIDKSVQAKGTIYTCSRKDAFTKYDEVKFLKSVNLDYFGLPDDTLYFCIANQKRIPTFTDEICSDTKIEKTVYMGKAITLEEGIKNSSSSDSFYEQELGASGVTRFAVREDDYMMPMYNNRITYAEYCEQYSNEQGKGLQKKKL